MCFPNGLNRVVNIYIYKTEAFKTLTIFHISTILKININTQKKNSKTINKNINAK